MKFRLLLSSIILPCVVFSQEKETKYWQQEVNTTLKVRLDDEANMLHGTETFQYKNNSPDTLTYIYIHLWPNAYKNDRTAFCEQQLENGTTKFYYSKEENRGYIDSLAFAGDGRKLNTHEVGSTTPDITRLELAEALPPGASVEISTPFRVKIPIVFSRLGYTGQAYYISQWYPKPAVYDSKGWHAIPYLDQGEFFNEYGSYDVEITLPENYIVLGTGNCTDARDNAWMDSLSNTPLASDTAWKSTYPVSSGKMKTLHFEEKNVHDFAWFADKRWQVRKESFLLPGLNDSTVAWAAFLPQNQKSWTKAAKTLRKTAEYLSENVGTYPYKTIKAVEGDMEAGGGMEYPTVTIIQTGISGKTLQTVLAHEAGHNWFQGILGSNERTHPWMDEGINSYYEQRMTAAFIRDSANTVKQRLRDDASLLYFQQVVSGHDQPTSLPSTAFTDINYGGDVYVKTPELLYWLEDYMGKVDFEKGMHQYFETWKHKHPYPADFQNAMQANTGKPIAWFFNGALNTDRPIDFKMKSVKMRNDSLQIQVANRSEFAAPVKLEIRRKNVVVDSLWSRPFSGNTTIAMPKMDYDRITIADVIPDAITTNNFYKRGGLFHRFSLQLKPVFGLNRSAAQKICILPAIGGNQYDGVMAGLLIHNITVPEHRFRYLLAPMYGFGSKQFTGIGAIGYSWFPENTFREVQLSSGFKTFGYNNSDLNIQEKLTARYTKISPTLSFEFRPSEERSPVTRLLSISGIAIREHGFSFSQNPVDSLFRPSNISQDNVYGLLRYSHNNNRVINPFSYSGEAQVGSGFVKLMAEARLRIDYNTPKKGLHIRVFGGKFFSNDASANSRYWLNSTYTGPNDYLYEGYFYGRSEREAIGSNQVAMREGGLKIPTPLYANPLGRSDNWLAAINLKSDLPLGKIPLRLWADVATFANAGQLSPSGSKILFAAGAQIHLLYDAIQINVPLIMSQDYRDYFKSIYPGKTFQHSITFTVQLQNIRWLNIISDGLQFLSASQK